MAIKRIMTKSAALVLVLTALLSVFAMSASAAESRVSEYGASVNLTLDGKTVLDGRAVIINSVTYVPVRSFSELAGADSVTWNASNRTATVKKGGLSITIAEGAKYIVANGRYFYTVEPILNLGGTLYVPIRPICKAFSIDVGWKGSTRTVVLKSTGKALVSGAAYYKSDEVYWLSRIINAESGGEVLKGKIAVGNVVLNRVAHRSYPNTIYGVIFDRKHGTQFTPVVLGTIYNTPSAESVIAAKICLEGYTLAEDILFFMNPRIATSNWISQNRKFAFRIGNHDFYY